MVVGLVAWKKGKGDCFYTARCVILFLKIKTQALKINKSITLLSHKTIVQTT
jgi:hypothetical protein